MNIFALAVVIGIAWGIILILKKHKLLEDDTTKTENNFIGIYRAKSQFFNKSEYVFFDILDKVNNNRFHIFSKVRLEDIIEVDPKVDSKVAFGMRKRINSRHIDFVLVDKTTGKTKAAIEVDGLAHNGYKAAENDQKKNDLLAAVPEINFYRIKVVFNFYLIS